MAAAVAAFLAEHPGLTGRFVVAVAGPGTPLAEVGRALERQIFDDAFGNDSATMAAEYGPYEKSSLFFVVVDRRRGVPAGVARMIEGDGSGVKTLDDAPEHIGVELATILTRHGMTGGRVWDCATLAVLPEYRGGRSSLLVSSLLYRTFLLMGRRRGVRHAVGMLDRGAYRNIRLIGMPLEPLAGSQPFAYLGAAENRAVYADFPRMEPAIREQAERLRRSARLGAGLRLGVRRLLTRRIAARVALRIGTGTDLDQHIVLPA